MPHKLEMTNTTPSVASCHSVTDTLGDVPRDVHPLSVIANERADALVTPPRLGDLLLQIDTGRLLDEHDGKDQALVARALFFLDEMGPHAGLYIGSGDGDWIPAVVGIALGYYATASIEILGPDEFYRVSFDEGLISRESRPYTCSGTLAGYGDLLLRCNGVKAACSYSPLLEELFLGPCGSCLLAPMIGGGDGLWHAVDRYGVLDAIDGIR